MCKQEIVLNVMKSIKSIKVIRDAETKKSDCVDVKGEESILNNEEVMEAPEGELVEGETE